MKVRMSWANISPIAKKSLMTVLDRGWLSYSHYQPKFEREVAEMHGAKYGILMSSGTDALRIALLTLKEVHKWPDGSHVIVPAVTFVATINAVLQTNLRPVFADVDLSTANLKIESVPATAKCVLPVHLFGLPAPIPEGKFKVVEDSCETFGVHQLEGDFAAFSFYMSHHVSAGVGGMLLTNNPKLEKIARSYMNHGRTDDGSHFEFGRSGYSARCTEMEAAVGLAALQRFPQDLVKRRHIADLYTEHLEELANELMRPPIDYRHSWMFYPVLLREGSRDKLLNFLRANEIESREAMPLINQPCFKHLYKKGSCPNAENWTKNGILLPIHPLMSDKDVEFVCEKVKRFYN